MTANRACCARPAPPPARHLFRFPASLVTLFGFLGCLSLPLSAHALTNPPLKGDIHVNIVYVATPSGYTWDAAGKSAARAKVVQALSWVISHTPTNAQGKSYVGVITSLEIGPVSITTDPVTDPGMGNDDRPWMNQAIRNIGSAYFSTVSGFNEWTRVNNDAQTAFTLFLLNYGGRCRKEPNEHAVTLFYYTGPCGWWGCPPIENTAYTYLHESLHVFGAMDEYNTTGSSRACESTASCSNLGPWGYPNAGCTFCDDTPSLMKDTTLNVSDVLLPSARGMIGWGDRDKDGILDPEDYCPDVPGQAGARCLGCPVVACDTCDEAACDDRFLVSDYGSEQNYYAYVKAAEAQSSLWEDCQNPDVCLTYYRDADGDTYGSVADSTTRTEAPTGFVRNATDCDDARATVNPGAAEICNFLDDNCNQQVDEVGRHPGDLNGDGSVTLPDLITALKIQTTGAAGAPINACGEVNDDRRIGPEEAAFILQAVAGTR